MSLLNTSQDPRLTVVNPMSTGLFRTIPLSAVILGFAITAYYYGQLPAEVPIHYGAGGQPDSYGPKLLLWGLPVINLAIFYGLEAAVSNTNFRYFNYPVAITEENASRQHEVALRLVAVTRLIVCLIISFIAYSSVTTALAREGMINMWIIGGFMALLFGSIAYFIQRAKKLK